MFSLKQSPIRQIYAAFSYCKLSHLDSNQD